jgi:AraC-like DNA-binding protein
MDKIPTHKISEIFHGDMASLRYISEKEQLSTIHYAHRHDYYLFIFLEKGQGKFLIDFEEYEMTGTTIHCILPEQVHYPIDKMSIRGWILMIDSMLVPDEYKVIFGKSSFLKSKIELTDDEITDLTQCISILNRRLNGKKQSVEQSIVHTLIASYIGMMAEIYQKGFPVSINNRLSTITTQFKSLLSANYQSLKLPSEYASQLNLSSNYLNEAVKKMTGLSVSDCIRNEIVLQAKRLLFYTNLSVKEIACSLGYDDYSYFTRLFTKSAGVSPTQFRADYRK